MTSLSYLAAVFLAKGVCKPVQSFVAKQGRCSLHGLATTPYNSFCSSQQCHLPVRCFSSTTLGATSADATTEKIPITLLSGFLGSGKTTTLQHLLENKEGLKIGVIVNDVASVNIDAKLVKNSDSDSNIALQSDGVIELQNGCACCSLADELLPTVQTLLDSKDNFDAIVVELSGVGDPVAIQQHWKRSVLSGHPVTDKADMKRIVTLIDSSTFGTDWMSWEVAGERKGWIDPRDNCAADRKVPELLAEQIEDADVLLLNKIDLAGEKQIEVAEALARSINDKAVVEKVEFGKIASPTQIVRDDKFGAKVEEPKSDCCSNPACTSHDHAHDTKSQDDSHNHSHDIDHDHSHDHSHATDTGHLGIVNFVYKADRAFDMMKLMNLLGTWPVPIKGDLEGLEHFKASSAKDDTEPAGRESPFFGVLRSKGFCWLSPTVWDPYQGDLWRHDTVMYWSHAGKHFGITAAGKWWATRSKPELKQLFQQDPKEYDRLLREDFVTEKWGDRRQELVFIGANIDQDKITKALDDCLLDESGMEQYSSQLKSSTTI